MGGMERASANLANALYQQGVEVSFISIFNQGRFLSLNENIKIIEPDNFNTNSLNIYKTVRYIRKSIITLNPDRIIVYNKLYSALTLLATIGITTKVFMSERSSPLYRWPLLQEWFCKLVYLFLKPDGIIAQTQIAKEYQNKYYGKNTPIKVIPNILREVKLYPEIQRKNIILAVGRLNDPLKGFDMLIEAYKNVAAQDWKLVFAGGDWGEDTLLTDLILRYGLRDRVEFRGKVKDIDKVYAEASIFVIPSRSEGFPNALCEAMAARLPCISFDFIAGPKDIINQNWNGVLVPPNDVDKLAQTISSLIEDCKLRVQLGDNAMISMEKYKSYNIVKDILKFLQSNE